MRKTTFDFNINTPDFNMRKNTLDFNTKKILLISI